MKSSLSILSGALITSITSSFIPNSRNAFFSTSLSAEDALVKDGMIKSDLDSALNKELSYEPGKADTDFARRFGDRAGKDVKTVGEAFADFTKRLGHPVQALYRNGVSDIVGTTHLIMISVRFEIDGIWSLGLLATLDLLLKNYPDKVIAADIRAALFGSMGLNAEDLEKEAKTITDWAQGKSQEDVAIALSGEGDSPVAKIAKAAKANDFWMYSKWFGIGLIKIMEIIGLEMESETCYPIMEDWLDKKMEKPYFTACTDSDQYFRTRSKLEMLETLMKEVEIREKKKLAQRLEAKAEEALAKAEREEKLKAVVEADQANQSDPPNDA
jgi:hypothetical protein